MLSRIVLSVIVGIIITLICILVGTLLESFIAITWVVTVGAFIATYSALLGLLAALWYFFSGATWPVRR